MSVELPSALPRGAFAKSVLMSANDIIHWSMLCDKLGKVVEGDAKAYGVELVTKDLSGVLEANRAVNQHRTASYFRAVFHNQSTFAAGNTERARSNFAEVHVNFDGGRCRTGRGRKISPPGNS